MPTRRRRGLVGGGGAGAHSTGAQLIGINHGGRALDVRSESSRGRRGRTSRAGWTPAGGTVYDAPAGGSGGPERRGCGRSRPAAVRAEVRDLESGRWSRAGDVTSREAASAERSLTGDWCDRGMAGRPGVGTAYGRSAWTRWTIQMDLPAVSSRRRPAVRGGRTGASGCGTPHGRNVGQRTGELLSESATTCRGRRSRRTARPGGARPAPGRVRADGPVEPCGRSHPTAADRSPPDLRHSRSCSAGSKSCGAGYMVGTVTRRDRRMRGAGVVTCRRPTAVPALALPRAVHVGERACYDESRVETASRAAGGPVILPRSSADRRGRRDRLRVRRLRSCVVGFCSRVATDRRVGW